MKTRHIKIDRESLGKIREHTVHFEKVVDQLDDDALDALEDDLQKRIRSLLQKIPADTNIPTIQQPSFTQNQVIPLETPRKRSRALPWKTSAFLMAAALLFSIRHADDIQGDWVTKGSDSGFDLPCELHLVQGDRSSPEAHPAAQGEAHLATTYLIDANIPTFLRISCNEAVYAQIVERIGEQWVWLVRNQALRKDFIRDEKSGAPLDLTPYRGSELRILASRHPRDAMDPASTEGAWSEDIRLRQRD